jgi:hypothetical protein
MNIIEKPFDPADIFKAFGQKQNAEESLAPNHVKAFEAGYEFKILRSPSAHFGSPERLAKILGEERENGWELVEKLDNSRIRLARLCPSNRFASANGIDPYRAVVGTSMLAVFAIACGVFAAAIFLGTYLLTRYSQPN